MDFWKSPLWIFKAFNNLNILTNHLRKVFEGGSGGTFLKKLPPKKTMKIEFLGTGAADWKIEKRKEGEFWRRCSSVLINDELLIDPGPHIFDYAEKTGRSDIFGGVKAMILTHSHSDHLNVATACRIHELTGAILYGYKTADYKFREKNIDLSGFKIHHIGPLRRSVPEK